MHKADLLQPAFRRLELFKSRTMRGLMVLATAGSVLMAPVADAAASDVRANPSAHFDLNRIGDIEIAGTGLKIADLGEFAPVALELLARGFPPAGILKEVLKAGMDAKAKIEARAQRAEDLARMTSIEATLLKVSLAMAAEFERQAARFEELRADNRKTHEELAEATRQRDELKAILMTVSASNAAIAAEIKKMLTYKAPPKVAVKTKVVKEPASEPPTGFGIPITKEPDWLSTSSRY